MCNDGGKCMPIISLPPTGGPPIRPN
jgi:hypothetical protein